jgi:hypothetical protein
MNQNQTNRPFGVHVVEEREGAKPFWNTRWAWPGPTPMPGASPVRLTSLPLDLKGSW